MTERETIRLVLAVPTAGKTHIAMTFSLVALVGKLTQRGFPGTTLQLSFDYAQSSCIHDNREQLVMRAIAGGATHLLFIDDDIGFVAEAVSILFGRRKPIVCCNYLIKRDDDANLEFMAVGLDGVRIPTVAASTGLQEIEYAGFGLSLFDLRVFRATPQPWFMPEWRSDANRYSTEDLPCFRRLRAAGFPTLLDHDASKLIEHKGDKSWRWDQWKPVAEPSTSVT